MEGVGFLFSIDYTLRTENRLSFKHPKASGSSRNSGEGDSGSLEKVWGLILWHDCNLTDESQN